MPGGRGVLVCTTLSPPRSTTPKVLGDVRVCPDPLGSPSTPRRKPDSRRSVEGDFFRLDKTISVRLSRFRRPELRESQASTEDTDVDSSPTNLSQESVGNTKTCIRRRRTYLATATRLATATALGNGVQKGQKTHCRGSQEQSEDPSEGGTRRNQGLVSLGGPTYRGRSDHTPVGSSWTKSRDNLEPCVTHPPPPSKCPMVPQDPQDRRPDGVGTHLGSRETPALRAQECRVGETVSSFSRALGPAHKCLS